MGSGAPRKSARTPEEDGADTEAPQYTDNFSIDTEAVTAFAEQIQAAVAEKNLEALADLASYPLYIGFSDGGESVESRLQTVGQLLDGRPKRYPAKDLSLVLLQSSHCTHGFLC